MFFDQNNEVLPINFNTKLSKISPVGGQVID